MTVVDILFVALISVLFADAVLTLRDKYTARTNDILMVMYVMTALAAFGLFLTT